MKSKNQIVKEYNEAKKNFDRLSSEVGKYFMPRVKKALKNDNLDLAVSLMYECPDVVTQVFIADAINQHKKK